MKKDFPSIIILIAWPILFLLGTMLDSCTKIASGYITPNLRYPSSLLAVSAGEVSSSDAINFAGITLPAKIKWTHIYDSTGTIVDSFFSKTYPTGIWTAAYNALTDTTYAEITAKRGTENLQPIVLDSTTGVFTSTPSSLYLPLGTYTVDISVSNSEGTVQIKNAMTIIVSEATPLETSPDIGNYSIGLLNANTASGASYGVLFNGPNNPFVVETITRYADTPNLFVLKVVDKNGVIFNGSENEFVKRPEPGLDPVPPYLQNLQDYAPDTFNEPDSGTLNLLYPLVPFPLTSLGNGYNMYYRIPTAFAHIDSTAHWVSNTTGNYYMETSDSHFLGYFEDGLYDYSLRIPMRIFIPGSYELKIQLLNVTHR